MKSLFILPFILAGPVVATYYKCATPCSGVDENQLTQTICNNIGANTVSCTFHPGSFCDVGDINSNLAHAFEGQCNSCNRGGTACTGNCDYAAACGGF